MMGTGMDQPDAVVRGEMKVKTDKILLDGKMSLGLLEKPILPSGMLASARVWSSVMNPAACDNTPAGAGLRRHPIFDWVPGASLAPAPPPGYPAQTLGVGASRRGAQVGKHFGRFSPRRDPLQR